MAGALLSKFSPIFAPRRGCVPSLLFHLRPDCDGGNEDDGTSFKRSCAGTLSAPNHAWATTDPCLHWRHLYTHGQDTHVGYIQSLYLLGFLGLIPWSLCTDFPCLVIAFIVSVLSDYEYCSSNFLLISIYMKYLLSSSISLCVSLGLKWVSYRQHIYESCFCLYM